MYFCEGTRAFTSLAHSTGIKISQIVLLEQNKTDQQVQTPTY